MQNFWLILFSEVLTGDRAKDWVTVKDKGTETVVCKLLIEVK